MISLLLIIGTAIPAVAKAGVLELIISSITGNVASASTITGSGNIQTMPLLKPAMNIDPAPDMGGGDVTIVDETALMPEEGPAGTIADIEKPKNSTISVYVVREGDTLSGIAKLFDVSPNTILWANDLPRGSALKVGQKLTILPITGVKYTIKKGDTLSSVAKKFSADAAEIGSYNGIDDTMLAAGDEILIPNGEVAAPPPAAKKRAVAVSTSAGTSIQVGYYLRPATGVKTQGIHGYNGVDFGVSVGTPILASASGDVIVAKEGGYNGGYGSYVVIQHGNGSQTLYAHASNVIVSVGQHVTQGQVIAYSGNSGRSTGPHLHFEIRNGIRNPF